MVTYNEQQVAGMGRYAQAFYGKPMPSKTSYTVHPQISDYTMWAAVNAPAGADATYFQQNFPDAFNTYGAAKIDDLVKWAGMTNQYFTQYLPKITATPYTRAASMTMDEWTKLGGDPMTWYAVREPVGQTPEQLAAKYPTINQNQRSHLISFYTQYNNQKPLTGVAKQRYDLLNLYNQNQQAQNLPTVTLPSSVVPEPVATPTPEELITQAEQSQQGRTDVVNEYYNLNPQETPPTYTPETTPPAYTPPAATPTPTPTWGNMDTTPIDTLNAQDITWRNLPPELFTFPFWREGMSGSTSTAGSTPGYTMQQPRYSPELFFPAAQQWGNWTPSERSAYQSAVQGTGASWDDVFEGLKKKWGVFTNTVQPTWARTGGSFNWTPAGYNK